MVMVMVMVMARVRIWVRYIVRVLVMGRVHLQLVARPGIAQVLVVGQLEVERAIVSVGGLEGELGPAICLGT